MEIPIHRLIMEKGDEFDLKIVAGEKGIDRVIKEAELHRPGLAITGFLEVFTFDRIQIIGNTETAYMESLPVEILRDRLEAIFRFSIPCIVVTSGNRIPPTLVDLCNEHRVPLLLTPLETTRFNAMINFWMEREFAPAESVHSVFVDVFGEGVLITGGSGIGKSECGLELIERGHRLVADDVVLLRRLGKNILMGSSSRAIQHHMEVRGLGIIDVELLFGIGAVREEKRVSLNIHLEKCESDADIERLGLDQETRSFLDVPVRFFRIPVESGRNLSILIEVAALHHRILERGINPAEELNKRLIKIMMEKQQKKS